MTEPSHSTSTSGKRFTAAQIEQFLATGGHDHPLTMVMQEDCAVHKHHEWVPVNKHHIWPQGFGGPSTPDNLITLCTNGHYAIHEFIRQLILHGGTVPWTTAQHFGPKVRDIARIGWERAGKPTKGGIPE
jgi:hypothetical protein